MHDLYVSIVSKLSLADLRVIGPDLPRSRNHFVRSRLFFSSAEYGVIRWDR